MALLDNAALKDLLSKNGDARCEARDRRPSAASARDERAASCKLIGCVRMTVRYRSRRIDDMRERPRVLAEERRRSGYRSLHVLLRFSRAFSLSSCFNR